MAPLSECYLLPLTKSVERTVKCTFNSSEPLFPVPQNICYCSLVLELNLHSNQIELFFLTLVYLKSFRYNLHYWQARTFTAFTFHVPRMQYSCSKLYLHITVTANYWPKKSAELHNARTFFCWSSLQIILQVFFLKIVIDQRAIGNYPAIQMTRSSTMFI